MEKCKCICIIDSYFQVGKHYKVKDLVDYVGISREAYNNIVNGTSMPRVNVALKICEFFTKTMSEIVGGYLEYKVTDFWIL